MKTINTAPSSPSSSLSPSSPSSSGSTHTYIVTTRLNPPWGQISEKSPNFVDQTRSQSTSKKTGTYQHCYLRCFSKRHASHQTRSSRVLPVHTKASSSFLSCLLCIKYEKEIQLSLEALKCIDVLVSKDFRIMNYIQFMNYPLTRKTESNSKIQKFSKPTIMIKPLLMSFIFL